jgi:hypothetical protein
MKLKRGDNKMLSPYRCDFSLEERRAKSYSDESLSFAIRDAKEAIQAGVNPSKYLDQLSVYTIELKKREQRKEKRHV